MAVRTILISMNKMTMGARAMMEDMTFGQRVWAWVVEVGGEQVISADIQFADILMKVLIVTGATSLCVLILGSYRAYVRCRWDRGQRRARARFMRAMCVGPGETPCRRLIALWRTLGSGPRLGYMRSALRGLDDDGLVTSYPVDGADGRPVMAYRLTAAGVEYMAKSGVRL